MMPADHRIEADRQCRAVNQRRRKRGEHQPDLAGPASTPAFRNADRRGVGIDCPTPFTVAAEGRRAASDCVWAAGQTRIGDRAIKNRAIADEPGRAKNFAGRDA
jgi:hypothetical protein